MSELVKKKFNFVVMTNSRVESTVRILGQLACFQNYGNLIISDSGGRGLEVFYKESKRASITLAEIDYMDNSKHSLDSIRHFHAILESNRKNMFIFHDDDEIVESSFKHTLEYLSVTDVHYFCSTKTGKGQFFNDISTCNQSGKVNRVLKAYFLSYDGNCPLFTGLFVKHPLQSISSMDSQFMIQGKYADVAIMSWFLSQIKADISLSPYMKYIEHDGNGNNIRSLADRISLAKFVSQRGGITNRILSLLIFRGYPEKRHLYIFGVLLTVMWPFLWPSILKKLIHRIFTSLEIVSLRSS